MKPRLSGLFAFARFSSRSNLLRKGLLALGSTTLSLLLVEVGLRTWAPLAPELAIHLRRRPDPLLGWRFEPNLNVVLRKPGFEVRVTTNSRGFRDTEHQLARSGFRVVILGDSFMEGIQVDRTAAFPSRLSAHLEDAYLGPVETINLGVSGFGTLQESLAYETEGDRYHPDLVLLAFYLHNDLIDNSKELEADLQRQPVHRPYLDRDGAIAAPDFSEATRAFETTRRELTWRLWGLLQSVRTRQRQSKEVRRDGALVAYSCEEMPPVLRGWAQTARILDRLKGAAERGGSRLAVFSVPSRLEVDRGYRKGALAGLSRGFCFDQPPGWSRLEGLLAARSIPYVDLRPAFRQAEEASPAPDLFAADDDHWNGAGHELAAATVAFAVKGWRARRSPKPP